MAGHTTRSGGIVGINWRYPVHVPAGRVLLVGYDRSKAWGSGHPVELLSYSQTRLRTSLVSSISQIALAAISTRNKGDRNGRHTMTISRSVLAGRLPARWGRDEDRVSTAAFAAVFLILSALGCGKKASDFGQVDARYTSTGSLAAASSFVFYRSGKRR